MILWKLIAPYVLPVVAFLGVVGAALLKGASMSRNRAAKRSLKASHTERKVRREVEQKTDDDVRGALRDKWMRDD